MSTTDDYARLPLHEIYIDRSVRQRKEIKTAGLIESVKALGILNPIIVERKTEPPHKLLAGERRYTCALELGLATVPVRFAQDLTEVEAQILELDENIRRSDLKWQEVMETIAKLHKLYSSQHANWTQMRTAQELGLSNGVVSMNLTVAAVASLPALANAGTLREAYNTLKRKAARAADDQMDETEDLALEIFDEVLPDMEAVAAAVAKQDSMTVEEKQAEVEHKKTAIPIGLLTAKPRVIKDASKTLLHESFVHWAPKHSGTKFNFIHCDFPYGVNMFGGSQAAGAGRHTEYADTADIFFELLESFCTNLDNFCAPSAHIMFWYGEKNGPQMRKMLNELAPSIRWFTHPLIWHRSDNSGILADPQRAPRHVYETALFGSRGDRKIAKSVSDCYSSPSDRRLHPSAKPVPMLRHFFEMFVDEHTKILDPTVGSASSIRAAESLGAREALGLEIDEEVVGNARRELNQFRATRTLDL